MAKTFNPYMDYTKAFATAETFLAGGKSKTDRPVANNTRLVRVDADTIALVLHDTAVVTYLRDGTFVIYGGGWNTRTTKDRIKSFSPARPYSDGHGEWIIGYTGELTPPRVQKCRTCKGRGRWMEADKCFGPSWNYAGGTLQKEKLCSHGQESRHSPGESERVCYRCSGEGRTDYGSNRIPITVDPGHAYRVDAAGAFLDYADKPHAPMSASAPVKHAGWHDAPMHFHHEASSGPHIGASLVDSLASLIPDIRRQVTHPVSNDTGTLHSTIVSLNDTYRWTREQIADWLETLSLDLRFPVAGHNERNMA